MTIDDLVLAGHNFEITPALQELVNKKFNRLINHYGHFMVDTEVLLKIDNDHRNIAEVNINVPDKQLNASATTGDMYKSLDEVLAKVKQQLEKYKELHFGHQKEQRFEQQVKTEEQNAEEQSLVEQ